VIARCANLPTEIRNGNGVGGGRVVGWLPIVSSLLDNKFNQYDVVSFPVQIPEDSVDAGKVEFVNFKRLVWHQAFHCVIKSIIEKSKEGCWLRNADGVESRYFPGITILSADYEEQHVLYYYPQSPRLTPMYY
jgi:hypothetical protein